MRKYSEYNNDEGTSHIVGAQPHRLVNGKSGGNSIHYKSQKDPERADKIHDKYSRSERRNFIQVANKMYFRPIVH